MLGERSRYTPLPAARDDARLRRIVDEMPVGVLVADLVAGAFVVANARALEVLGPTVAVGSRLAAYGALPLAHLDGRPCRPDAPPLVRALAGARPDDLDVRVRREDGSERLARLGATPLLGREGRPVGAVATCQDIAGELATRAERERVERFREAFLGVVGHDLRFPLGVIALTATTLLRDEGDVARQRALERIVRSAGRMERMIEQLLDLTRLRVGAGIEVDRTPMDLGVVVAGVVDAARDAAPGGSIALEREGDLALLGDADRLEQVIENLVSNAVRHGEPGRPVRVRADGTEPQRVVVSVANAGVVPPGLLPALFEPFQARPEGRALRSGLGLGLWISRQIAASHGGTVEVRSAAAEGTRFTLALPRGDR